jgi:ubiquitin C-terminal hydrolase
MAKVLPQTTYMMSMDYCKLSEYQNIYKKVDTKEKRDNSTELRDPNMPVGLRNVLNACYLTSLLQCYFLMGSFTR